jgi:hypothetical protein
MIRAAVLALIAAPAFADQPLALQNLLDYHTTACTAQSGVLTIGPDAIVQAALNGPEAPAYLLDSRKLACSGASAMFCGDGVGCELNVFVGEAQHSLVVLDWALIPDADRQLLQVTIAAELVNRPKDLIARMAWDNSTGSLVTLDPPP